MKPRFKQRILNSTDVRNLSNVGELGILSHTVQGNIQERANKRDRRLWLKRKMGDSQTPT